MSHKENDKIVDDMIDRKVGFEDFLMEKFIEVEEPCTNDCTDQYDRWIEDIDIELLIIYAEQYAVEAKTELLKSMRKETK